LISETMSASLPGLDKTDLLKGWLSDLSGLR